MRTLSIAVTGAEAVTLQTLSVDTPVSKIILDYPQTRQLFEKLRIDYHCCGDQSLRNTAQKAGVDPQSILSQLESELEQDQPSSLCSDMSLADLCCFIVNIHHAHLKKQLPGLDCLFCKIKKTCPVTYTFMLKRLNEIFKNLLNGLNLHMAKEEQILFPTIAKLEGYAAGESPRPQISAQVVQTTISQMKRLHAGAASALSDIRDLTEDYSWLDESIGEFQTLYNELASFEDELHEHIHYENNLLFPRTIELMQTLVV